MKATCAIGRGQIEVVQGMLGRYDADALVLPADPKGESNTFSTSLSGPSTLERNASKELKSLMAIEGIDTLPPASVYLTDAIEQLQYVMYIIHAVTTGHGKRRIIADCTRNALELANKTGLKSVGFPLLGSSYDNILLEELIEIIGREFIGHLQRDTFIERIGLVLKTPYRYSAAKAVFDRLLTQ